ncbi:hypothetical protein BH20ACI1_BH20ACI1_11070 [soil metagenome]
MPRPHITKSLRQKVTLRAAECCEYCLVHQDDRPENHQIDHITALKHDGTTDSGNLALACVVYNKFKGSDLTSIDPLERIIVPLFNPRTQIWSEHFELENVRIVGLTPVGRATAELLKLNDADRLIERQELWSLKIKSDKKIIWLKHKDFLFFYSSAKACVLTNQLKLEAIYKTKNKLPPKINCH